MNNEGWVKLHRKSFDNFLYKTNSPHTKREAWEDILLFVNYNDTYWSSGNEKLECKRGQSLMSLDSWGRIFNWNKSRVKRFFSLLEKEKMIVTENVKKTTRLTVCNYDTYQGDRNTDETQMKRKRIPIKEVTVNTVTNNSWREDFDMYLKECKSAFKAHDLDENFISSQERINPGVDISLTMEKAFTGYWGSIDGWENKKSKKTRTLNWHTTIIRAISNKMNKVYKQKN